MRVCQFKPLETSTDAIAARGAPVRPTSCCGITSEPHCNLLSLH